MEQSGKIKTILASVVFGLFALIVFGLIWFFFLGPSSPVGVGWYFFSFAAGLSMIVLPCTLPLAFVIVPLSMGKGAKKGIGIALSFSVGVVLMLSMYGVIAAAVGQVAIGTLGAPLEVVKNWLYFIAGAFAFAFALGEIGLVNFHMPTYTGAAPAFIQKQQDYLKALLLGLFLGNIGVGCPHPATPVILTRIAVSGDIFYGWLLFLVHAAGRVLPLLLLAFLAILGVNALNWLVKRKDKIEHATGWGMVFVAAFILVLGLFTHAWWVNSGQHTFLEEITQEERFLGAIINRFGFSGAPHHHGLETGTGLLGLPLWLGNWVLVALWLAPVWWHYLKKKKVLPQLPEEERKIEGGIMPWRFWLFITLSAFLALTFIRYLPDRFLHMTLQEQGGHGAPMMMGTDAMPASGAMPHEEAPGGHGHAEDVQYHEEVDVREGLAINLNFALAPAAVASPTRLDFFVNQKPGNAPVAASELQVEHTKLMHVIGIRDDLNEFFHIHPQIATSTGVFSVDYTFENPGTYKVWSEIKKDGVNHSFGHPTFQVVGPGRVSNKQVAFVRDAVAGNFRVALILDEPVVKNHAHGLAFHVHTASDGQVSLDDYLGAKMHLTIIKDDLKQFIHTHPESGGDHSALRLVNEAKAHGGEEESGVEIVNFSVSFPESGLYKALAQFRPGGANLSPDEAYTVSFWIQVEEKAPPGVSAWWLNLIISLILIVGLSVYVRRYLTVK